MSVRIIFQRNRSGLLHTVSCRQKFASGRRLVVLLHDDDEEDEDFDRRQEQTEVRMRDLQEEGAVLEADIEIMKLELDGAQTDSTEA